MTVVRDACQGEPDADVGSELTARLSELLARIDDGELVASAATRNRVEGALVALRVLDGDDPSTIVEALTGRGAD